MTDTDKGDRLNTSEANENPDIAIIGMAGRFPGAGNVAEFWDNLRRGLESISSLSDEELEASGIDPSVFMNPQYVRARGVLEATSMFDASFFGFNPREAEVTDPQHRLFLECAWEVLESAGYDPQQFAGRIGLFAGESNNTYLLNNLFSNQEIIKALGLYQVIISNDRDHLATLVSYKLNLRGPSVVVQSACSTSLVAVHLACQSLLNGESDMALAGGVSVGSPQKTGYMYREGGIASPDGHCRSFDAQAAGTVGGSGLGLVLLKRLPEALAEHDQILALIKGSAINNDGGMKVGYTAPSVAGQAEVIAEALAVAGVGAESISYVEAHGTATPLGDPVEVAALTQAYRTQTEARGYCAIGSVKSNIGHLDAAAGVTGLIKTVLALGHGELPASLHYVEANPAIEFGASPFYVNAELRRWERQAGVPRRAGVSSFGIGGTNAHVILEEAPQTVKAGVGGQESEGVAERWQVLPLSARTVTALEAVSERLSQHLQDGGADQSLADVAFTLQQGRRAFERRRVVFARSVAEAAGALTSGEAGRVISGRGEIGGPRPVVFLFPGQGAQRPGMGQRLYEGEERFRREVDECAEVLRPVLGMDVRAVLYPAAGGEEQARERLRETEVAQAALFVTEYALAQLLMERGVRPAALLGHSVGEYVAACVAGVWERDEALRIVAARGRLMQQAGRGAMLSVSVGEERARRLVEESGGAAAGLWLAAHNGPQRSVVSGAEEAVAELERRLVGSEVKTRRLETSHAFHSGLMEGARAEFERELQGLLGPGGPRLRMVSNVTGRWLTTEQAGSVGYWGRQLREPVRFAAGVEQVLELGGQNGVVLVEVGPGRGLTGLARQVAGKRELVTVLLDGATESAPGEATSDQAPPDQAWRALAEVWVGGGQVSWPLPTAQQRRLPLPTYPFERQHFWIEPKRAKVTTSISDVDTQAIHQNGEESAMPLTNASPVVSGSPIPAEIMTPRVEDISRKLKTLLKDLSGIDAAVIDREQNFFALGFDSLLLMQVSQAIQNQFGVDVAFRQLFEEFSTLDLLAAYLEKMIPEEALTVSREAMKSQAGAGAVLLEQRLADTLAVASSIEIVPEEKPRVSLTVLGKVMDHQMLVMSQQLSLLQSTLAGCSDNDQTDAIGSDLAPRGDTPAPNGKSADQNLQAAKIPNSDRPDSLSVQFQANNTTNQQVFGPWRPVKSSLKASNGTGLTAQQQKHLKALIARYNFRTQESKRLTQAYRPVLADTRVSAGFRLPWKDLVYPIVGTRAKGGRLWDVDDNEYVDLVMGFGVNLFGHSPPFIVEALADQLKQGIQIGPQSHMAGKVAELFCTLTGMERMTFCNTGSEAVMAALRVARTVTGRKKIALFAGSYHGITDEVLTRVQSFDGQRKAVPAAPGIVANMSENVLVLDYGTTQSLEILAAQMGELAAVLVEPVQSSRPEFQPLNFLRELRTLTEKSGTALIFDEMITGFRLHCGGAQSWFGVRADIATYGKVVGGGMPIGILAGSSAFMGAVDGGMWTYGDDSYPQSNQTFFAGTFSKHPLALAASWAVLNYLKDCGPELQQQLNQRTTEMGARLNAYFERTDVPMQMRNCGSLFRFVIGGEPAFSSLLIYHLLEKGIFVADRSGFLSTAHTSDDIDFTVRAIQESVDSLRGGGFIKSSSSASQKQSEPKNDEFPLRSASGPFVGEDAERVKNSLAAAESEVVPGLQTIQLTTAQKGLLVVAGMGDEASRAYNEAMTVRLRGALNVEALRQSLQRVVARHDSLRATFDLEKDCQRIAPSQKVDVPLHDFSAIEPEAREARTVEWLKEEIKGPFDLFRGPVFRVSIVRLATEEHLLVLTTHHLLTDGWSFDILLDEIMAFYKAECQGVACILPPATQFGEYAVWQAAQQQGAAIADSESYWLSQFRDGAPILNLPTSGLRPSLQTYAGERMRARIDATLTDKLRTLSGRHRCTLFMTLLGSFQLLLHQISGQDDLVVGTHSAGQSLMAASTNLIGFCINMLPMRSRINQAMTFVEMLGATKQTVLEGYKHQNYPMLSLVKKLKQIRDPSRPPLVSVVFNMDRRMASDHKASGARRDGLEIEPMENPVVFARFDLLWNMIETGQGLALECTYNSDLFDPATIREWTNVFEDLLREAVQEPERKLSDFFRSLAIAAAQRESAQRSSLSDTRVERLKNTKRRAMLAEAT